MRSIVLGALSFGVAIALATACGSGSAGPAGPAGPAGSAGPAGPAGAAGGTGATGPGADGGVGGVGDATTDAAMNQVGPVVTATLSAHAQIGLASAPVPLALAGKTTAQLEQIGQGAYIVATQAACPDCHSKSPAPKDYLAGGVVIPIGPNLSVVSRNLTPDPATGLKDTVGQYVQATRNGADTLNGNSAAHRAPLAVRALDGDGRSRGHLRLSEGHPRHLEHVRAGHEAAGAGRDLPRHLRRGRRHPAAPARVRPDGGVGPRSEPHLAWNGGQSAGVTPPDDPTQAALFGRGSYIVNAVVGCSECHTFPDRDHDAPRP